MNPEGGGSCTVPGMLGPCAAGVQVCTNGALICQPTTTPMTETCNGVDDNCNGSVDEGNPGGGATCTVAGQLGACANGQIQCSAGALRCTQIVTAMPEVCNNRDDNCNGMTDESLGSTTCGMGVCARTVQNCVSGTTQTCTPGTPSAEVCDGDDDNCDGTVDNGPILTMCPLTSGSTATGCRVRTTGCDITACSTGTYDFNGAYSDGCECVDDASAQACASATNGGSYLATQAGNLPAAGTGKVPNGTLSDYYTVTFPSQLQFLNHQRGTARVTFTTNDGTVFRFEVRSGPTCPGTVLTCGNGGTATGLQDWTFADTAGGADIDTNYSTRNVGYPVNNIVRVYRANVNGTGCENYVLRVSR